MNKTEHWFIAFVAAIIFHFGVASLGLTVLQKWRKPVSFNQEIHNVRLFNSMDVARPKKTTMKAPAPSIEKKNLPKIETKKVQVKNKPVQKKKVEIIKPKVEPPPKAKNVISTKPAPIRKKQVKKEAKKPQENPDDILKKKFANLNKKVETKNEETALKERFAAFEAKTERQQEDGGDLDISSRLLNMKIIDQYKAAIGARITEHWTVPDYLMAKKNLKTEIIVIIDNNGRIISTAVKNSSSNKVFDDFATKAVEDSNPMPAPPKELGTGNLEIVLNFVPEGMEF